MDLIGNGVYLLWMSNRRAHLWGFGFNQFGQINDTEEDVYSPVCIDSFDVTADEVDCGIVCWAGWADLLYFNKVGKSPRETIELIYRGSGASEKLIQCAESWLNGRTPLKSFGNESLVGLAKGDFTEARLCKNGGADIEHQIDLKMNEIAVSGTGHIAVIDDSGAKLIIYPPSKAIIPQATTKPFAIVAAPRALEDKGSSSSVFRCLSAGDAHFSFIVDYRNPHGRVSWGEYLRIWSIRTDSRSMDDAVWIPIEEELCGLDDPTWVTFDPQDQDLQVFCGQTEELENFAFCESAGWITVARTSNHAWIFPFDRALSLIPGLYAGKVDCFSHVIQVAVGSNHITLVNMEDGKHQLWTFGLNDHGQCGFSPFSKEPTSKMNRDGWHLIYETTSDEEITQLCCGKWNTFFIIIEKNPAS